jgi:hypothetical protein
MKSGHSYYREHLGGGDLRKIGGLNEIEDAIMQHFMAEAMKDGCKERYYSLIFVVMKLNMSHLRMVTL